MNTDVPVKRRKTIIWSRAAVKVSATVCVLATLTAFASWGKAIFMNHGDHYGWFGILMIFFALLNGVFAGLMYDTYHSKWGRDAI